ncbi:MAG: sigma-70 family RNA polymerase sigma factor [Acidobacteria bacterium]|nr:sigma-70 family RNA polymerase sigma factor [Acidobacteriota bacterium]
MPDTNDPKTLQAHVADAHAQITSAVRFACQKYNHGTPPEEVEEFTEQLTLLLLEQDCRRIQTHDPSKASFKTWLQHVVNHHVSRQLQKNRPAESLEDELLNTLSYPPAQEKELLWKERRAILEDAIATLSLHDQRIARLKLNEAPDEEIAQELNIKAASVGREWRVIKTKLAQMVREGAQSKAKQSKDMMHLENFCVSAFSAEMSISTQKLQLVS